MLKSALYHISIFAAKLVINFCMILPVGHNFKEFTTIDSTNLYATMQVHAGKAHHGDAFFAHTQLAGRGQRGRQWFSVGGQNIALSVVLETAKLNSSQRFRVSAAMAMGVLDWAKSVINGPWKVKWPNDIYYNDRKAGGILIENQMKGGRWSHSVVGIGINMNQHSFPVHLPNPISFFLISGNRYSCIEEAKAICSFLETRWQQLTKGHWHQILQDYNESLYGRDEICKIKKEAAVIPCKIRSVNEQGQLIAGESNEWIFEFGEVSWVI